MVAWWWIPIAASTGACIGVFVMALCVAAGRADELTRAPD